MRDMERGQVHYELFVRRQPGSGWALELATEDRVRATETAEQALAEGRVAAVRVTKETLDPETREFMSVTILSKGAAERYAAFVEMVPTLIAGEARRLEGDARVRALDAYGKAREAGRLALRLSLDPATTAFRMGTILASIAPQGAAR